MTLLVANKISMSGIDFSGISINGADISGGIFHKTNFTQADLSNVVAKNCIFS